MESLKIKSITAKIHDTGYGGIPYKVTAIVEMSVKEFNKLCPIVRRDHNYFGSSKAVRKLSGIVVWVNNAVYDVNRNIPAHNPSIDPHGHKRAKNGVKTMVFEYFLRDHEAARALGFEFHNVKSQGEPIPKYGQYVNIPVNEVA